MFVLLRDGSNGLRVDAHWLASSLFGPTTGARGTRPDPRGDTRPGRGMMRREGRVEPGKERQLPIIKKMASPITGALLRFRRTEYREPKAPG